MFIAAVRFADLQDGKHLYNAGDIFPRKGLTVSAERIAELAGSDNRTGHPLIKAVEPPIKAANETPDKDIGQETKPAKKRPTSRKKKVSADD